jgi:hypothetical protein
MAEEKRKKEFWTEKVYGYKTLKGKGLNKICLYCSKCQEDKKVIK